MKVLAKRAAAWRSAPVAIFTVAILIVIAGIAIVLQNESNFRQNRINQTLVQAEILASSVAAAVDFNDPLAAQEAVDPFRANRQLRWIGVYGRDGSAIAGYGKSGTPAPMSEEAIPEISPGAIRVSAPVAMSGQRIGTVHFETDLEPVSSRLTRYLLLAALVVLAALFVAALGTSQLALRRANRELAERAEALAQANELLEEQMEERAKAQDELRQSHKMQALGQLTGGIAHDFNNLLTVIQGSADMLCRKELPEQKRVRFAQAIVQASANAASLTSQLLAFARRQPLKPEQLDLNSLLLEMEDLIDRTVGERIEVTTELSALRSHVEVDRGQLQSAILNIASNARDAMPEGGRLSISTRDGGASDPDGMVALEIADSGAGMDAETVDRIFEPFFTTKSVGKGTGLGLSQVYGFASQSGGDVKVESAPGKGTRLTIFLPFCDSEEPAEPVFIEREVGEQQRSSILVVEDNEEVGAFAESLLTELGHDVTRADSGEQALELCRQKDFDLVFSDVVMPGMGGLKLAETLAEEKPDLPVVLATGYSQEIAETGSGGRPVILKPYRLATLAEAMRKAVE